ncbi:hypothetical protein D3C85_882980 [compost metagenome]
MSNKQPVDNRSIKALEAKKNLGPSHQFISPIGLAKPMPHGQDIRVAFLDNGKGSMSYSLRPDGEFLGSEVIRISLHSSDGLDAYYFDIEDRHILEMAEMIRSTPKDRSPK